MLTGKNLFFVGIALAVAAVLFAGCRYYQVTEAGTGKIYYTKDVDYKKGGAVGFKDAKTDAKVVLQSSEVQKINKKQFKAAVCPGK